VYLIVSIPDETPVTTPEEAIVDIAGNTLLHVPAAPPLRESVMVLPTITVDGPVILVAVGIDVLTEIVRDVPIVPHALVTE
jgi:hypothetical protein